MLLHHTRTATVVVVGIVVADCEEETRYGLTVQFVADEIQLVCCCCSLQGKAGTFALATSLACCIQVRSMDLSGTPHELVGTVVDVGGNSEELTSVVVVQSRILADTASVWSMVPALETFPI